MDWEILNTPEQLATDVILEECFVSIDTIDNLFNIVSKKPAMGARARARQSRNTIDCIPNMLRI